jgi:hypothetical protein
VTDFAARIFLEWPIWLVGLLILALLIGLLQLGVAVRRWRDQAQEDHTDVSTHEGYIVSGVVGLLALLLGFTFAVAMDRFDTRRVLVLEEANAIGTTYLRAQLLDEPHRSQLSRLLQGYTENRLALAGKLTADERQRLVAQTDDYQKRLWTATVSAIRPIRGLEISSGFVETMNSTIDAGAARVAARRSHVPVRVLAVLLIYMSISAFILGFVMPRSPRRTAAAVLLGLLAMSYVLILDIDRPTGGAVRESQEPMENLLAMMRQNPPASFGTVVSGPAPAP